jgi:CO dehydrogenase maturation factor
MTISWLIEKGKVPILAVDADPNSTLDIALGVTVSTTIAEIREEVKNMKQDSGLSRPEYFELLINQCIVENNDFDLLSLGRPEGPGCYCAVNNILRENLKQLAKNYKTVVIDNEAGMEHLSRRTSDNLDILFIVASANKIGLLTAKRAKQISEKLSLNIKRTEVIINNIYADKKLELEQFKDLPIAGVIPFDKNLFNKDTLVSNLADSIAYKKMVDILEKRIIF